MKKPVTNLKRKNKIFTFFIMNLLYLIINIDEIYIKVL